MSMYQRILVPYDGSATSSRGLDEAIRLASLTGASIRLLHMIDVLLFATGFESGAVYVGEVIPYMRQAGEAILQEGQSRVARAGVKVETTLVDSITTRLCDAVNEQVDTWGADLVVIGTHGRRGVGRLLLGSDAERIVRTARVPVLLIRAAGSAAAAAATPSDPAAEESKARAVPA